MLNFCFLHRSWFWYGRVLWDVAIDHIIIITKLGTHFRLRIWSPKMPPPRDSSQARGVEAGGPNPAPPSPPEWWAPRPSPRLRHSAPVFRTSFNRDVRKSGAGWWGRGGGVWGGSVDSRARLRPPRGESPGLCSAKSRLLTPPYPPPPQAALTVRPHIRGGEAHLGGRGGWLG